MAYDYKKHEQYERRNAIIGHLAFFMVIGLIFGTLIYQMNKLDNYVNEKCEGSLIKCFTIKKTK